MILVIGNENCNRCLITKNILIDKNIEFEYKLLNDLKQEEKDEYLDMAQKANVNNFPLLIKDKSIVTLQEVN